MSNKSSQAKSKGCPWWPVAGCDMRLPLLVKGGIEDESTHEDGAIRIEKYPQRPTVL